MCHVTTVVTKLNVAIDHREEGLVVRDLEAVSKSGGRAGAGWVKVKPEYKVKLVDTPDLVVLGGYLGRAGRVSHFLLAVRDTHLPLHVPRRVWLLCP